MLELLDFHKKMYDARWNVEKEYVSMKQLEDDFVALADKVNVDFEKVNEMLEQLYIPPYKYDLLPEHLRHSKSAKREVMGRPSLGATKKVSITLPNDIWEKIGKEISDRDIKSMSAFFREMALDRYKERGVIMKKLLIYKENEEFIIERVNEFNHSFKNKFISEQEFHEGLKTYKPVIEEYELEVSEDLWGSTIKFMNSKEFQE